MLFLSSRGRERVWRGHRRHPKFSELLPKSTLRLHPAVQHTTAICLRPSWFLDRSVVTPSELVPLPPPCSLPIHHPEAQRPRVLTSTPTHATSLLDPLWGPAACRTVPLHAQCPGPPPVSDSHLPSLLSSCADTTLGNFPPLCLCTPASSG